MNGRPVLFMPMTNPLKKWTWTSRKKRQTVVQEYIFYWMLQGVTAMLLEISYRLWFHIQNKQSLTTSRFRGRKRERGCRSLLTEPSRSRIVTSRNEFGTNGSHQTLKIVRRNPITPASFTSSTESCKKCQILAVPLSNVNTIIALHYSNQPGLFKDFDRTRDKVVSLLNNSKNRAWYAVCNLICVNQEKKALMKKMKLQWTTVP